MYLRSCPMASDADSKLKTDAEEYFSSWKNGSTCFLASSIGKAYAPVFADLRLHHILTSSKSLETVVLDNIVPKDIIDSVMAAQWRRQLAISSAVEKGEENALLEETDFYQKGVRCGRVLPNDNAFCWRWTGYFFGVDLLLAYKNRVLAIRRNCNGQQPPPSCISVKAEHKICYRLQVVRFNEKRQQTWAYNTGFKWATMKLDESVVVARIPSGIPFPVTVVFSFITVPFVEDFASSALVEGWKKYTANSTPSLDEEGLEEEEDDDDDDDEAATAASMSK